jgi:transcriptional regulator with XRE-family HTH domain
MKYSDYRMKLSQNAKYQQATEQLRYQFAFGDAILEARLKRGWSQTELARRAGTKQANISRIEAGISNPTLGLIKKICDALDLELIFQPKYYYPPVAIRSDTEILQSNFRGVRDASQEPDPDESGKLE